jgi:hypothetical protein
MTALQCALCPFRAQCGGKLCSSAGGAAFKGFSEWAASSGGAAATSAKKSTGSSWINDMGNEFTEAPDFHEFETAGPEVLSRRVGVSDMEGGEGPLLDDRRSLDPWHTKQGLHKRATLEWSTVDSSRVPSTEEDDDDPNSADEADVEDENGYIGSWAKHLLDGAVLIGLAFMVFRRFHVQIAK